MTVATYNMRHGSMVGTNMALLAEDIRRSGADLVGVQEIDIGTARVGGQDTLRLLASASGMPYYAFCPTIRLQGGRYGTALLSRQPFFFFVAIPYVAKGGEARAYSRAYLRLGKYRVAVFNTHLEYADTEVRTAQAAELAAAMSREPCRLLTGDFNTADFSLYTPFGMTAVNRPDNRFATFYEGGLPIDNILYTAPFRLHSCGMIESGRSDHYLLWADLSVSSSV